MRCCVLKPQDVVVVLKIAALKGKAWTYQSLASSLRMSASGAHESVGRAVKAGLLQPRTRQPIRAALEEFLVHGARYAFPPERGRLTRGMPTAAAAPPLRELLADDGGPPLVWADPRGTVRGESLAPLARCGPAAASADPQLYELLAVVDALRAGGARERQVAAGELRRLLAAS